jgi:CubicO group peptidase (beta-lactamase class C family)
VEALAQIDAWPAPNPAATVVRVDGVLLKRGDGEREYRWASVTKILTALATLVAAEEGTIDLDDPAGPPGSTVRHLLAHASGLPFHPGPPLAPPGKRRIYSNVGFDVLGEAVGRAAGMPFSEYFDAAVVTPLGLSGSLQGTAADGFHGPLDDLVRLARQLLVPTLIARETLAEATTVAFPGLDGVLPDYGRQSPNDWGLGVELKDEKTPHWTGSRNSPRTFGHFGSSGSFLWVDPDRGLACACLTDHKFGPWAKEAWPTFSDTVLRELGY